MSITRSKPHRRRRTVNPEINQPELATPIYISSVTVALAVMTITFDQPVSLGRGAVPQFTTDIAGAEPLTAVQTAPNAVRITFSAAVAAATDVNIPYRDPAIRNSSGGYVTGKVFTM